MDILLKVTEAEHTALTLLAQEEMRTVEQQARYLVAQFLIEKGLLQPTDLHTPVVETIVSFYNLKQEHPGVFANLIIPKQAPEIEPILAPEPKQEKRGRPKVKITLPTKYRYGKETRDWRVLQAFVNRPNSLFTSKDLAEATGFSINLLSGPIYRMRHKGVIEESTGTTDGEGRRLKTWKLTEGAKNALRQRNEMLQER